MYCHNDLSILGTHDIISASAIPDADGINISARFVENSNATGAFFIFINYINDDVLFTKTYSLALSRSNVTHGLVFPLFLWPGMYRVYTYDIESDRKLRDGTGYQAYRHSILVSGSKS